MPVKQVIVMRKDLKMRRGKEIAQGAHASISWLTHRVRYSLPDAAEFSAEETEWMVGRFTKVCVQVDSEEELQAVHRAAREAGLESHLIIDSGQTEFHGEPTLTCCAIGPDEAERIDPITGKLRLY